MRHQGFIYAFFAILGVVLSVYCGSITLAAWHRFGLSGTFGTYAFVTLLLAILSALSALLAFLFFAREVTAFVRVPGGFELTTANRTPRESLTVPALRHIRTFGQQFSKDESAPAYALFLANGKLWLSAASTYQAADNSSKNAV